MSNGPVKKIECFPISTAIWQSDDGRYSVTVQKRYKDREGAYKNTDSMNAGDAIIAAKLMLSAADWMLANSQREGGAQRPAPRARSGEMSDYQPRQDGEEVPF